jgi:Citrate transporter
MSKVLGRPKTDASAQLRLMVPITILSAFLNNTPIVVVMIPIVQKWAKNINVSVKQLLIPLSFASIIGGTCTLIGTSTNLVVAGLLEERYPNDPSKAIKLFDLSIYGVRTRFLLESFYKRSCLQSLIDFAHSFFRPLYILFVFRFQWHWLRLPTPCSCHHACCQERKNVAAAVVARVVVEMTILRILPKISCSVLA